MLGLLWSAQGAAGNFIGLAQPGVPDSFGMLLFPSYSRTDDPRTSTGKMFTELAWYSKTGFTGTTRDQFEVWLGFYAGRQTTPSGSRDDAAGVSTPQLGLEYFYQVVQPGEAAFGTDAYRSWWISPLLTISGPNGSRKTSGFGAGANQWSLGASVNNYFAYGRWHMTIAPVVAAYAFRNRSATELPDGASTRYRGGLTLSLMDVAAGYQVTPNLIAGVHHAYNLYSVSRSDFKRGEQGMVGPTFTYLGFSKQNFYISGTLDFDYHNKNVPRGVALNLMLVKSF